MGLVGEALGAGASTLAIPASRFADDVFVLRSGKLGAFVQKFVNYRVRLAIVGEIGADYLESQALRSFIAESNRGDEVWFVADEAALAAKLG